MSRYLQAVEAVRDVSGPLRAHLESEYGPCTIQHNGRRLVITFYHRDAARIAFQTVYAFLKENLPGFIALRSETDTETGRLFLAVGA
jgi:hypothetical protein